MPRGRPKGFFRNGGKRVNVHHRNNRYQSADQSVIGDVEADSEVGTDFLSHQERRAGDLHRRHPVQVFRTTAIRCGEGC